MVQHGLPSLLVLYGVSSRGLVDRRLHHEMPAPGRPLLCRIGIECLQRTVANIRTVLGPSLALASDACGDGRQKARRHRQYEALACCSRVAP
jgi:hypothetical protein